MKEKEKPAVAETPIVEVIDDKKLPPTSEPLIPDVVDDGVIRINIDKPPVPKVDKKEPVVPDVVPEISVLEEIIEDKEKVIEDAEIAEVAKEVEEAVASGKPLPENIQKLVDFIEDTGGSLEDYVLLNRDTSVLDDNSLLREYYKDTKKHLNNSEVDFLLDDNFAYDEDIDNDRDIKRKKLAKKEELAKAKTHLDGLKTKYYDEIKAGSKLTDDQRKAVDFFNRYNKDNEETSKVVEKRKSTFTSKSDELFNSEFKGFEYEVGEKKYRFNVKNVSEVKNAQSDINNFAKKFLGEDQSLKDAKGYHKSLFTAMNADAVANHFYQQGKTDAIRESLAKAKNIDMGAQKQHQPFVSSDGFKARVVPSDDSSKYRIKLKT